MPKFLAVKWTLSGLPVGLRPTLSALLLTAALSVAGYSHERVAERGGLQAWVQYCSTCHGLSAQGYRGYVPMPRLAGQQPQDTENQLRAFKERRRVDPAMSSVARALSPSEISGLANYFRTLNPKPIGGAPRRSLALGKEIFEKGLPESNVPACSICHGADAKGNSESPRLGGQLYEYTVGQLTNWSKLRGGETDTSFVMAQTAHDMTRAQIDAVAAYVSYLP